MKFLTKFRDPFTIFILVYNQVGLGGGGVKVVKITKSTTSLLFVVAVAIFLFALY